MKIKKFIIVTQDHSGLGFAKKLADEGVEVIEAVDPKDDEENIEGLMKAGEGMVDKMELEKLYKARKTYKDWAWVFDMNHNSDMADSLRKEGFMVFGGHELTDKLEHDRNFGLSLIEKAGLSQPDSHEFSDIREALGFLEQNEEIAYVFKPDEPDDKAWVTTVPDSDNDEQANNEIFRFLESMGSGKGDFILQERKKGVEVNVEMWLYEGAPFFAHGNFECKRKYNGDHGKLIGCSQDTEFVIPLDCKVLKDTIWKLIELPEFKDYTGFIDMNLIVADNDYYFLEFCGRFGYNSHPNLFLTLAIDPISEILSDFITGDVDDFGKHFRPGYGASITLWIDEPVMGLPIIFGEGQDVQVEKKFYHFDTYKEGDDYFLAGYANEVGIVCAHDYDMKSAADAAIDKFNHIHYPGRTARTDLNKLDYLSNPHERLIAANAMKLFESEK